MYVRIYDETTKSQVLQMKEKGELPGHSNRIFAVKFNPVNENILCSGSWDNTVQVYDLRQKGPIESIYGPHICGDALDFRNDGYTLLTGSYRAEDPIQLYDLRNFKLLRTIDWDGPLLSQFDPDIPSQEEPSQRKHIHPAMLYGCCFNRKQDLIIAGGAGGN